MNSHVDLEGSPDSSDEEHRLQSRATALSYQAGNYAFQTDSPCISPTSPARPLVACDGHQFPPCYLTSYDNQSLSCGLFSQYEKWMKDEVDAYKVSDSLPPQTASLGQKPSMEAFLTHVIESRPRRLFSSAKLC